MRTMSWPIFKTHYYGGIRKYQWVTIPLELHGVVALKDGDVVQCLSGQRRRSDPMLTIDGPAAPPGPATRCKKPLAEAIPARAA